MSRKHSHASDLLGLNRLMIDALLGSTDLAEQVHLSILNHTTSFAPSLHKPLMKATSLVYHKLRHATNLAGSGIDQLVNWLTPYLVTNQGWKGRDSVIAVLNGVLGDYLHSTQNPLAMEMELKCRGINVVANEQKKLTLRQLRPRLNGHVLVLAHGLCMSDLMWRRNQHDHGAALEHDCACTAVYLRYNSGLHISSNGEQLAQQLESLVQNWPVPIQELTFLCHSMGGMLVRSAHYYAEKAGYTWPSKTSRMVFLGTPHHGAPLERSGHWFHLFISNNRYLAPFSSLGRIRSAGITDLRHGNLLSQDWHGVDRFVHSEDRRIPVPLPEEIDCYALAATIGKRKSDIRDRLLGDGLVPINSALGIHQNSSLNLLFKPENQVILPGMNHLDLLNRDEVYQQLLKWLAVSCQQETSCAIL